MEEMTIYDLVKKLIGNIEPVGSSHVDDKVFENLTVHCELVERLLTDLHEVRYYKSNHQHSMKKCGEYANEFLYNCGISEQQLINKMIE